MSLYAAAGARTRAARRPSLMPSATGPASNATPLIRTSRLIAKIDSALVQDGYDLYLHGFFATADGDWCVVQQGMNPEQREARRYHWGSDRVAGFLDSPHTAIEGRNVGSILNLADRAAARESRGRIWPWCARGPVR